MWCVIPTAILSSSDVANASLSKIFLIRGLRSDTSLRSGLLRRPFGERCAELCEMLRMDNYANAFLCDADSVVLWNSQVECPHV